jgi:hypothetical protein
MNIAARFMPDAWWQRRFMPQAMTFAGAVE